MSEPVDPAWVQEIILILKDGGVRRAKLEGLEVEFDTGPSEAPQTEYVQVPVDRPMTDPSTPAPRAGYSALFNGDMPKFDKPKV